MDIGILRLDLKNGFCNIAHPLRLSAANVYVTADRRVGSGDFSPGLLHQTDDLLGPFAEQHPLPGQGDPPFPPYKKLFSQLVLQLLDLLGQGRLRHMQGFSGTGDSLFPRHSQKVLQNTNVHTLPPFPS